MLDDLASPRRDVVTLTRLDRSTRDLLNSLGDTWADTNTAPGPSLMLTALGGPCRILKRDLIRVPEKGANARTGAV
jgi:hypothetical protein